MLIQNCFRCVIFTLSHMHALSPLLYYNCLTFSIMEKNRPLTMLAKGTKVKQGQISFYTEYRTYMYHMQ